MKFTDDIWGARWAVGFEPRDTLLLVESGGCLFRGPAAPPAAARRLGPLPDEADILCWVHFPLSAVVGVTRHITISTPPDSGRATHFQCLVKNFCFLYFYVGIGSFFFVLEKQKKRLYFV